MIIGEQESLKKCSCCYKFHSINSFYKDQSKKDGLENYCKACSKQLKSGNKKTPRTMRLNELRQRKFKQCWRCKKIKSFEKFGKDSTRFDQLKPDCKSCSNTQTKIDRTIKGSLYGKRDTPERKMRANLSNRLYDLLKRINCRKRNTTLQLVGCNRDQLAKYIEKQFKQGMSWNNYGEWHIDHKKPCVAFDLRKEINRKKCFHYTNLQPLWAKDNLLKGSTYKGNRIRKKNKWTKANK